MGRKRTTNKHLPRRVYQRRGKFYFAHPGGQWVPLGDEYGAALRAYSALIGERRIGTLADLFDRYAVDVLPSKAPRTQKDQNKHLELLRTAFGHLKPSELSAKLVGRYRNARGQNSQTQANQELALIAHICVKAVEWEVMEFNPCRDVKKFKLKPRHHYVDDKNYGAMRKAAGPRLRIMMDLALLTGQREGDLMALRWTEVAKDGIHFHQGKTGKRLVVEWSKDLRMVIARARQIEPRGDTVIATTEGKQYTTHAFQSLWQRTRARALEDGLKEPFPFNDLRAKSASDDALLAASERLGHADAKITQRVYRRAPSKVKPLNIGRANLFGRPKAVSARKKQAKK